MMSHEGSFGIQLATAMYMIICTKYKIPKKYSTEDPHITSLNHMTYLLTYLVNLLFNDLLAYSLTTHLTYTYLLTYMLTYVLTSGMTYLQIYLLPY